MERLHGQVIKLSPTGKGYDGSPCYINNQQAASKAEVGKPFPQEQELAAKTARLIELDMELNLDGKGQPQPEQAIAKSTRPSVLDRLKAPPVHGAPEKPHKKEMEAR